jgi:hypothetical protein
MALRVWKTNLILEDLARQKRTKMWPKWGLSWVMIDVWHSELSVLFWGTWTTHNKGSSCLARDCGHLDAACCHTASSMKEFFYQKLFHWFRSPRNRLILVRVTFLYPKLKFHLKRHFGTVDNIQKVVTDQPRALPPEDFQHCYRESEHHLRWCVASHGDYFEDDNVNLYFSC